MAKADLKALSFSELETFVQKLGWPKYRSAQLWEWIYRKKVDDFSQMTNLSKADRTLLQENAFIGHLKVAAIQKSEDGTTKYLMELADGMRVEAVLIPGTPSRNWGATSGNSGVTSGNSGAPSGNSMARPGEAESRRLTLCISTQVGCSLDCVFCYTGTLGLKRNLKAHEIVDQVAVVQKKLTPSQHLTNVVLMGMGEPLANYREVTEALNRMVHPKGLAIPPRRITLSTAGLVPQIEQFMKNDLKVNLAVSLNAPNQSLRDRLMPKVNRAYPLAELIAACRSVPLAPRKRITFEYTLLGGVNDTPEHAKQLARLVRGLPCKINLIPFNDFPESGFNRPEEKAVLSFQKILRDANLHAFVRKTKGRDILAACGQLAAKS